MKFETYLQSCLNFFYTKEDIETKHIIKYWIEECDDHFVTTDGILGNSITKFGDKGFTKVEYDDNAHGGFPIDWVYSCTNEFQVKQKAKDYYNQHLIRIWQIELDILPDPEGNIISKFEDKNNPIIEAWKESKNAKVTHKESQKLLNICVLSDTNGLLHRLGEFGERYKNNMPKGWFDNKDFGFMEDII